MKPLISRTRRRKTKKQLKRWKKTIHRYRRVFLFMIVGAFLLYGLLVILPRILHVPEPPPPDDRPGRIDAYFDHINAPLAGYGKTFVEAADACGMDWRLLPAIAMRESTGGKRMQYNNPFGWGGAQIPFQTMDEAIRDVGAHVCGTRPSTEKWYGTTSTEKKLYYYNGTVIPTYPDEVMWIMEQF